MHLSQLGLNNHTRYILALCLGVCLHLAAKAQPPGRNIGNLQGMIKNMGNSGTTGGLDSIQKRNPNEDSITISYRLLNDSRRFYLDSVINEYHRFPVKPNYVYLGNNGAPAKPLLFTPNMQSGWDAGFHALDMYRYQLKDAPFYRTTRPYTELGYVLGSKAEQVIQVMHTQNIKPDWNAAFMYRTLSAPGYFRSQKNNHTNIQFTSMYQGKRKRYTAYLVVIGNKLKASDNGGIKDLGELDDPDKDDRYLVNTNLNNNVSSTRNPFNNTLESGRYERESHILLRQHYDLGKRDSIQVNDTTMNYLFYPKLRLQHTFTMSNELYSYIGFLRDSSYYKSKYGVPPQQLDTLEKFQRFDKWKEFTNDFSLYQFPDTKNQQQYIHAGVSWQLLKGTFDTATRTLNNIFLHGGYRNRTRNRKWDIEADGKFYLAGYNSGDYEATVNLTRILGTKLGSLRAGLKNTSRTPSFVFYSDSRFNFQPVQGLKKENLTHIYASFFNEKKEQSLNAGLYLVANYTTWRSYKIYDQDSVFNFLYAGIERKFRLRKHLFLHTEATLQQAVTGDPHINVPFFFTRNRIGYEGDLGYKNLRLALGLEIKYNSPYKASGWSPLTAQFLYQDTLRISNRPEIAAYMHFAIKGFNAFVRIENLNTAYFRTGDRSGLKFNQHNFSAPLYPDAVLVFRLGIYWRFIN